MKVFEEHGITHLDLHGQRHHEVKDIVIDFIYRFQNQLPLIIICGNSVRMIDIVKASLESIQTKYADKRFGVIRVEKV